MSKDMGKISTEDFSALKEDEMLTPNMEATAFCNGFIQGFLSSFQGFNGETFKEFDRPVMDSENFRNNMALAFNVYIIKKNEMEAMIAIEKGQRLN